MIRLAGACFLIGGAVGLSLCASRHLRRRVEDLTQLQYGIECMAREMKYRLAPLPELLRRSVTVSKGNAAVFYELCACGAEHLGGRTFQQVWQTAMETAQLRLEPCDVEVLTQLGGILGRYDGESQRKAIDLTASRLEVLRLEAAEQSGKTGRAYWIVSLTAAGFLLVLLI